VKYVLVNRFDEIISSVDMSDGVGITGATTYFQGVKQMENKKDFDSLWRVMTQKQWEVDFKNSLQNRQMDNLKYKWWEEDAAETDEELSGKDGRG